MRDKSLRYFVETKVVGGRGRDRTGDPLLAKQVLSQLSYTPTARVTFILKHFSRFQNPFPRIFITTVPELDSHGWNAGQDRSTSTESVRR